MKQRPTYRHTSTDPRITNLDKTVPPLAIPYISNAQKNQSGTNKWLRMITSRPTVGEYAGLPNPRKTSNAKRKK